MDMLLIGCLPTPASGLARVSESHVVEQGHKPEIHMQLLMTVEEC